MIPLPVKKSKYSHNFCSALQIADIAVESQHSTLPKSGSVAVLTASIKCTLSHALSQAELSPKLNSLRSFSKVHSQEVAGNCNALSIQVEVQKSAAAMTLWWSSLTGIPTKWRKYCNHLYLTKSDSGPQSLVPNFCTGYMPGIRNSQNLPEAPHVKTVDICA